MTDGLLMAVASAMLFSNIRSTDLAILTTLNNFGRLSLIRFRRHYDVRNHTGGRK